MDIEIREMDEATYAGVDHAGPYAGIGEAFGRLMQLAGPAGLVHGPPETFGIYYDDPRATPEDQLRSRACLVVPPGTEVDPASGLVVGMRAGGAYAVATHRGSYAHLAAAWAWFVDEWMPGHGHTINLELPCFERYLNDPGHTPDEELLTELCEPVTG